MSIFDAATGLISTIGLQLRKYAPQILVGTGVVGVITSGVIACKATLKVKDVVEKRDEDVEKVMSKYGEIESKEYKKEVSSVYFKAGLDIAKLYLPSVGLGAVSIFCILTSNGMMVKRNAGLVAAYATVDQTFKRYRGNVVERFGEEVDKELRYNVKEKEIEEAFIDENGEPQKIMGKIKVAEIDEASDYARYFDSSAEAWTENDNLNMTFIRGQQNWANNVLFTQKYLFLNDVYDALGIKKSTAGQVVGWIYDKNRPDGDNYVDFGIREVCRETENGEYEHVILLDFNVDGNIFEKAKSMKLLDK